MKPTIYILLIFLLTQSCNNLDPQINEKRISKLEERIRTLEKQLEQINNSIQNDTIRNTDPQQEYSEYFTIGSTMDEVIDIMGEPSSYMKTAPEARKLIYGLSTVYFYQGKVISFDNLGDNLRVKVK